MVTFYFTYSLDNGHGDNKEAVLSNVNRVIKAQYVAASHGHKIYAINDVMISV